MPSYPYRCTNCQHEFDVVKPVADYNTEEQCPKCTIRAERFIARTHFYGASDWNQKEWNPAFGKALTPREARKEAKRRGMIEIGNESPENIEKHFAKEREKKSEIIL